MNGRTDVVIGRIKEAAGALIGNDRLREDGKTDQAIGRAKLAAQRAVGKVKRALRRALE